MGQSSKQLKRPFRMGFSFRRSSSFGPFRFNFSKSGIGASVGVKGARVTLSPRGKAYITVGAGGFSYRQNLSSSEKASTNQPRFQPVPEGESLDEIKTADVEELRASSKSELVENLNKRAQMLNPAVIVFVLSAICGCIGIVELGSAVPSVPSALPDASVLSDGSRQTNHTDEYALLLARYGQPSTIEIAQAGTASLRTAIWEGAHLAVSFVPAGCVDAYAFFQSHKNDPPVSRGQSRHRGTTRAKEPTSPVCIPPADKASTIVGYEDTTSHSAVDSQTADRSFAGLGNKSTAPPSVKVPEPAQVKGHGQKTAPLTSSVDYSEPTLEAERQREQEIEISNARSVKMGSGFLIGAFLLLFAATIVHRRNKEKRTTQLVYDLSEPAIAQQEGLDGAVGQLSKSGAIWRLDSQSAVTDWKRNAGAAYNVKRERIGLHRSAPPRVESNIEPLCLDFGKLKMFFLPDQILYWQRGLFASIEYNDLRLEAGSTRFIEESVQTSDSRQVGSTWRYVRKDGGPDRRFNNNQQLPIMLYGVVTASTSGGLNLILHTSNMDAASSFSTGFEGFQNAYTHGIVAELPPSSNTNDSNAHSANGSTCPANIVHALTVLGLTPGATSEQVAIAFRHMAQMYHPDKTVGLGLELQRLADERMKEINAAHQTVKRLFENA
jgi:hypothetical protein